MSIEQQATFWLRNVNNYDGEQGDFPLLSNGYRAFSDLMKKIYGDYHLYEISTAESVQTKIGIMADDLENYHNLTETVDCLYQMAAIGVLCGEGSINYLEIIKAEFKRAFKGSATFLFQILENHGFYFKYIKNGKEVSEYKNCDVFHLFNDNDAEIISAMAYICEVLPDINAKDDYIGKKNLLFSIADFDIILLKNSTKQFDIDPLKSGIINTAGSKGELWYEIIRIFVNEMKFTVRAYINPYVFPNWTVKFLDKKKTIATFIITPDVIKIELMLSYDTAKEVVRDRKNLPKIINASIDRFGCIGCGKCPGQSNIELFEGVNLCKLSSTSFFGGESRIITGEIVSLEEVAAIYGIVKRMLT